MKFTALITFLLTTNIFLGQEMSQFTEYDANLSMFNPAITGVKGKMYTSFTGRKQ